VEELVGHAQAQRFGQSPLVSGDHVLHDGARQDGGALQGLDELLSECELVLGFRRGLLTILA
jgi:hypothetical protein